MLRRNITPVSLYPRLRRNGLLRERALGISTIYRCEHRTVRPENALEATGIEFTNGKQSAVPTEADANDLDTARSALGEIAFNRCGNYVTNY
jgi:hypothetical protein